MRKPAPGIVFEDGDAARHLTARLANDLALLARHGLRDLFGRGGRFRGAPQHASPSGAGVSRQPRAAALAVSMARTASAALAAGNSAD